MPKIARIAQIDESACIGCAKCLQSCPVDAIIGAAGQMHTVIGAYCIGCALCLPPCPVNCITLNDDRPLDENQRHHKIQAAKHRFQARKSRIAQLIKNRQAADAQLIGADMRLIIEQAIRRSEQKAQNSEPLGDE